MKKTNIKDLEKDLEQLWGKVGFIVNLSQMIEYNLANILAFDEILREFIDRDSMFVMEYNVFARKANKWYKKLNGKELGFAIHRAEEISFFTSESLEELKRIGKERNYVVHTLFKEDLKLKHLETDPKFYFERLEQLIADMASINNDLCRIFQDQKEEHKLIW